MPDDDELDLSWPMPGKRDVYPNFAKTEDDTVTTIILVVNKFAVKYAGCGTHQMELLINIDKEELAKLLKEQNA